MSKFRYSAQKGADLASEVQLPCQVRIHLPHEGDYADRALLAQIIGELHGPINLVFQKFTQAWELTPLNYANYEVTMDGVGYNYINNFGQARLEVHVPEQVLEKLVEEREPQPQYGITIFEYPRFKDPDYPDVRDNEARNAYRNGEYETDGNVIFKIDTRRSAQLESKLPDGVDLDDFVDLWDDYRFMYQLQLVAGDGQDRHSLEHVDPISGLSLEMEAMVFNMKWLYENFGITELPLMCQCGWYECPWWRQAFLYRPEITFISQPYQNCYTQEITNRVLTPPWDTSPWTEHIEPFPEDVSACFAVGPDAVGANYASSEFPDYAHYPDPEDPQFEDWRKDRDQGFADLAEKMAETTEDPGYDVPNSSVSFPPLQPPGLGIITYGPRINYRYAYTGWTEVVAQPKWFRTHYAGPVDDIAWYMDVFWMPSEVPVTLPVHEFLEFGEGVVSADGTQITFESKGDYWENLSLAFDDDDDAWAIYYGDRYAPGMAPWALPKFHETPPNEITYAGRYQLPNPQEILVSSTIETPPIISLPYLLQWRFDLTVYLDRPPDMSGFGAGTWTDPFNRDWPDGQGWNFSENEF